MGGNKPKADSLYRQALALNLTNYVGNLFANQPQGLVSFRVNTLEYAGKISLVGTFNNWSTTANPFVRRQRANGFVSFGYHRGSTATRFWLAMTIG